MHPVASGVVKLAILRLPVVVLAGFGAVGFAIGALAGRSGNAPPAPPQLPGYDSDNISAVVAKLCLTLDRPCLNEVAAAVPFPSDLSRKLEAMRGHPCAKRDADEADAEPYE